MGPQIWLILALAASGPATYGVMVLKQHRIEVAAYASGKAAGAQMVAAATTASAQETVATVEQGERMAEVVPADKQKIIDLCKRSASCRDRSKQ